MYHGRGASRHIKLLLNATVTEIQTDLHPNSVNRVKVNTLSGKQYYIAARRFVMAMGGIDNARMLLVGNRHQKIGLGNEHDVVGRYFMERVTLRSGVSRLYRPANLGLYEERRAGGQLVEGMLALKPQTVIAQRMLSFTTYLLAQPAIVSSSSALAADRLRRALSARPRPSGLIEAASLLLKRWPVDIAWPLLRGNAFATSRHFYQLKPML